MKTPVFMVDAPILPHNPTISIVIRLGLCVVCVKCRYIKRLTVFPWYDVGKHWRTTARCSPKRNRLIYILYICSYVRRGLLVALISHADGEWMFVYHILSIRELLNSFKL